MSQMFDDELALVKAQLEHMGGILEVEIAENAKLRSSLLEISKMQVMPDDNVNRTTLHCAIEAAKLYFS